MNLEEFNIEQDLSIDKFKLDLEALSLPSIYFRYADALREARDLASDKKDAVVAVMAEREIAIRESCSISGVKTTESIIKAKVESDPEVITVKKELREANAVVGRIQAAVSALDTKRNEIDNLVKLYCSSYFINKWNLNINIWA